MTKTGKEEKSEGPIRESFSISRSTEFWIRAFLVGYQSNLAVAKIRKN